jgi:hypothetical protein
MPSSSTVMRSMKSAKQGEAVGYQDLTFFRNVGKHSPKGLKTRILDSAAVGRLNFANIMVVMHRLQPCSSQTRLIPPCCNGGIFVAEAVSKSPNKLRRLYHRSLTEYSLFRLYNYMNVLTRKSLCL